MSEQTTNTVTIGGCVYRIWATYAPKNRRNGVRPRTLLPPLPYQSADKVRVTTAGGKTELCSAAWWLGWAGDEVTS
jgi:hypothetical protein